MPPYLMMRRQLVWLRSLFSVRWVSHPIWSSSKKGNRGVNKTERKYPQKKQARLKQHSVWIHISRFKLINILNVYFTVLVCPISNSKPMAEWLNLLWKAEMYQGCIHHVGCRPPYFRLHCRVSFWLQLTVVNLSTHDDGSDNTSSRQFCKALHNLALRATKPGNVTKTTGCARPACEGTTENDHTSFFKNSQRVPFDQL